MDIDKVQTQVLYPEVRVRAARAGGSGTIIYSKPKEDNPKQFSSYAITCHHVIEEAITVRQEWDPKVGREKKTEFRQLVTVELFDYESVPHGNRPVNSSVDAEVVAYDKPHDMALLKLRSNKEVPYVAELFPKDLTESLRIGSPTITVGCALLHDPVVTDGHITHMGDEIDYKLYWMSSALSLFGNSGGAVFSNDKEGETGDYKFVGIPSRIDVIGWGQPVTHLGYFSPVTRVREFLEEQMYEFIDPSSGKTEAECEKNRKERADDEKRRLMVEGARG